jgi:hypothetical protein
MLGCGITGAGWKPPSGITRPSLRVLKAITFSELTDQVVGQ